MSWRGVPDILYIMHLLKLHQRIYCWFVCLWTSYQFLEDACRYHTQEMESMTRRLQEKKKLIEEVSDSINNGYVFIYTLTTVLPYYCRTVPTNARFKQQLMSIIHSWGRQNTLLLTDSMCPGCVWNYALISFPYILCVTCRLTDWRDVRFSDSSKWIRTVRLFWAK